VAELVDALDSGSSARKGVEVQVLFWATLNHFGVRIKAISSEVAFFVFWHQKATDASIDAFWFVIEYGKVSILLSILNILHQICINLLN
jgi:hypothetical protein